MRRLPLPAAILSLAFLSPMSAGAHPPGGSLSVRGALHTEEAAGPEEGYILLVNDSGMDWFAWKAELSAAGIFPRHFFPPDAAIVAQDAGLKGLQTSAPVPAVIYEQIADAEVDLLGARSIPLRAASNALRHLQGRSAAVHEEPGAPLINDALEPPPEPFRTACSAATLHLNTAEYMLGSVTVTVILPESTGAASTEDWTAALETNVTNEITEGLNDLSITYYNRIAALRPTWTMVYILGRTDARAQVTVEPISNAHPDDSNPQWINTIYNALGYTAESTSIAKGRHFNGDQRDAYGTKWAYTVFVANSVVDADGLFSDGYFGYAYLGGPYELMTYDNDGWGISQMNKVHRHEGSHIFYALDEYSTSPCTCTETSGYVAYANQNCNKTCATNVPCIMNESASQYNVCAATGGMIGWGDADGDTIPDPVDIEPETTLTAYTPDPTTNATLTYTGNAQIQKKTNQNVYNYHCDYNILNIANVQYRVDSGAWQSAAPSDGAFNSGNENYTFTLTLANGTHTVEARAVDELGQTDSTPASDSVTVNAAVPPGEPAALKLAKSGSNLVFTWTAAGTGCSKTAYAVYRGTLGSWYSHNTAVTCAASAGPYSVTLASQTGTALYYLVTAINSTTEGSYGRRYPGGAEIPVSSARCKSAQNTTACN